MLKTGKQHTSELQDGSPVFLNVDIVEDVTTRNAVGSEFASRHTQYEMFYSGASFVTRNHSFRSYEWNRSVARVDNILNSYSLEDEIANLSDAK